MKKLFLLITIVLFVSCSNDDKESSTALLNGSWKVISISGGIAGKSYPTDVIEILEFSGNTLKTYRNSILINTQTYSIQRKKSIFGGIKKMIVTQTNSLANDVNRVQSYEIAGDKLSLRDECFDCYTMEYVKINPAAF